MEKYIGNYISKKQEKEILSQKIKNEIYFYLEQIKQLFPINTKTHGKDEIRKKAREISNGINKEDIDSLINTNYFIDNIKQPLLWITENNKVSKYNKIQIKELLEECEDNIIFLKGFIEIKEDKSRYYKNASSCMLAETLSSSEKELNDKLDLKKESLKSFIKDNEIYNIVVYEDYIWLRSDDELPEKIRKYNNIINFNNFNDWKNFVMEEFFLSDIVKNEYWDLMQLFEKESDKEKLLFELFQEFITSLQGRLSESIKSYETFLKEDVYKNYSNSWLIELVLDGEIFDEYVYEKLDHEINCFINKIKEFLHPSTHSSTNYYRKKQNKKWSGSIAQDLKTLFSKLNSNKKEDSYNYLVRITNFNPIETFYENLDTSVTLDQSSRMIYNILPNKNLSLFEFLDNLPSMLEMITADSNLELSTLSNELYEKISNEKITLNKKILSVIVEYKINKLKY